jgi:hypothetical protein
MKLVITIVVCLLIGFSFSNIKKTYNKAQNGQTVTNAARASSSTVTGNTSENSNIEKILRIVAEKCKKTDVNGDGKYNCIDAAVLFYQYYPDKSKVCIEMNVNPKTGLNHLFNCVFTDGVWKGIEPQAYAANHSNYLMWAVWGSQYDNSYNRDVTSDFLRYVSK